MIKITGFGIAIDTLGGHAHDVRLLDHSPVLQIERVHAAGGARRFGLVEHHGKGKPPATGLVRSVADVFVADRRTAEFVQTAVIQKIEQNAAEAAEQDEVIEIFGATLVFEEDATILRLAVLGRESAKSRFIDLYLQSRGDLLERMGNTALASLIAATGIVEPEDTTDFIGHTVRATGAGQNIRFAPVPRKHLAA